MNKKWIAFLLTLAMVCVGAVGLATGTEEHVCDMVYVNEGVSCEVRCTCGATDYWHSYDADNPGVCMICTAPCEHEFNGTARCVNCYYYMCPHNEIDDSKICSECACTIYIVTYDPGEGSGTSIQEKIVYKSDAVYLLPECTFTAPEYGTFLGWNVNGTTKSVKSTFEAVDGMTITAVWDIQAPVTMVNVTFVPNNNIDEAYQTQIEQGAETQLPPLEAWNFSNKENHTFEGWNDGKKTYTLSEIYVFTNDVTFTAVWQPNGGTIEPTKYTVTFSANGGTGSMASVTMEAGEYELPPCGFTAPNGKQFAGWNVNGSTLTEGAQIQVSQSMTITAVWEDIPATKYTITFDANGGTGSMTAGSVAEGAQYTLPACGFTATMDGDKIREFDAWEVEGKNYQPGDKLPAATCNITVKAIWKYAEQTKVVAKGIETIPSEVLEAMPEGLKTVEEIVTRLEDIAVEDGFEKENVLIQDVTLKILDTDTGAWIDATEDNFPTDGITVTLDLPKGTNATDYEFVVTHMFTVDSARLGTKAGTVETPKVSIINGKIVVTLKGLSPVSITWKVKPSVASADLPSTGDPSSLMAWVTLLGASGLGVKAIKRRKK